jgi:ABC-type uncharacterized transport system ATPase subunit
MLFAARSSQMRQASMGLKATRELRDDLDSLLEIAKQNRAPITALSLAERTRADLQAYLDEIDPTLLAARGEIRFKTQQ